MAQKTVFDSRQKGQKFQPCPSKHPTAPPKAIPIPPTVLVLTSATPISPPPSPAPKAPQLTKQISTGAFQPGSMPRPKRRDFSCLTPDELREIEQLAINTVRTANGAVDNRKRAQIALESSTAWSRERSQAGVQLEV